MEREKERKGEEKEKEKDNTSTLLVPLTNNLPFNTPFHNPTLASRVNRSQFSGIQYGSKELW